MPHICVVAEGPLDLIVAERLLGTFGLDAPRELARVTNGKTRLDERLTRYNAAARHGNWFVLRDADRDGDDCPASLRRALLLVPQNKRLCFRLAVRSVEAWLLADREAFAGYFAVASARIPARPEEMLDPKRALVEACRFSGRRDIRRGLVPPEGSQGTGPEYTALLSGYCREAWRPDKTAESAPSLVRAQREIERLTVTGTWT